MGRLGRAGSPGPGEDGRCARPEWGQGPPLSGPSGSGEALNRGEPVLLCFSPLELGRAPGWELLRLQS